MRPSGVLLAAAAVIAAFASSAFAEPAPAPSDDAPTPDNAPVPDNASLFRAAFAPGAAAARFDPAQGGLVVWRSQGFSTPSRSGDVVDDVRLSTVGVAAAPGGVVVARPDGPQDADTQGLGVHYVRRWPGAFRFSREGVDVDVSPHAGVGLSTAGGSAEAGATLRVGANLRDRVIGGLNGAGVRTVDGASFGDRGRWYLFAAVSGQSLGYNMTHDANGGFRRAGFSADPSSNLTSNAQAGIGWRKGGMQASVGYVQRQIQPVAGAQGVAGQSVGGSMVAVSLSVHGR